MSSIRSISSQRLGAAQDAWSTEVLEIEPDAPLDPALFRVELPPGVVFTLPPSFERPRWPLLRRIGAAARLLRRR
ncbi:MAG TPA: hypothetical protein VGR85_05565 [Candidatus Limnocylindria bacterium]|nr:hypothetical protein [Candidatus Limnocylindria bacterium]